jgi:hypothetical protein
MILVRCAVCRNIVQRGRDPYCQDQPDQLQRCIDVVLDWSRRKRLLAD